LGRFGHESADHAVAFFGDRDLGAVFEAEVALDH